MGIKTLKLTIPGRPVVTPRPRVTKSGHAYIPEAAREAQAEIACLWDYEHAPSQFVNAVEAEITFQFVPPSSWPKGRREAAVKGKTAVTSHSLGDIDNLVKTVLDGLNHHAYTDDAQVIAVTARKKYGWEERTDITLVGEVRYDEADE